VNIWNAPEMGEQSVLPRGTFIQLCFVVEDLQDAMRRYSAFFGAGPWFVSRWWERDDDPTIYRGSRKPLATRIALAYAGDMLFELACPELASPSIFSEWVDRYGFGIHHYGFGVDDVDAAVSAAEAASLEILFRSTTPRGTRVAMVDGGPELRALKEFIELTPKTRKVYEFMQTQARGWDGRELIFAGEMPAFD